MGPFSGLSLRGCKSPARVWNMEHHSCSILLLFADDV